MQFCRSIPTHAPSRLGPRKYTRMSVDSDLPLARQTTKWQAIGRMKEDSPHRLSPLNLLTPLIKSLASLRSLHPRWRLLRLHYVMVAEAMPTLPRGTKNTLLLMGTPPHRTSHLLDIPTPRTDKLLAHMCSLHPRYRLHLSKMCGYRGGRKATWGRESGRDPPHRQ